MSEVKEQQLLLQPKRTQYYMDPMSRRLFSINANTGFTQQVDQSGIRTKSYHTDVTGCVGQADRVKFAKKHNDESMIAAIDYKKTKLRVPNVVTDFLFSQQLGHFVPSKTPKQYVKSTSNRREILNLMITYNSDLKYGLPAPVGADRPKT